MEKTSTERLADPSMKPSPLASPCSLRSTWPARVRSAPWEELESRLIGRGTEGPEEQARRLATARVELEAASEFDHVVINDDVERAVDELARLIGLE